MERDINKNVKSFSPRFSIPCHFVSENEMVRHLKKR